jgi:TonB-linked SusC/RagA family outer membrane protein
MKQIIFHFFFFIILCTSALAQQTVEGTVADANGDPLVGVNVIEQGTTNGTSTDVDGQYQLNVSGSSSVLIFSFLGFETVEREVGQQSFINIVLREDTQLLDDVVVSALGFEQNRDKIGSTSSVIKPEDITRSGESTFINSLGAKASNVRINRSNGDPGSGSTIRIRGANTIDGNGSPLIIVDGLPLNNSTTYGGGNNVTGGRTGGTSQQSRINDINPSDIKSVQILKGASAGALYGSRAANGVIVITTKNGSSGEPEINYKLTQSFDRVSERYPMQTTFGQGNDGVFDASEAESWGDYIPDRAGGSDDFDTTEDRFIARDGTEYFPIINKNSRETYVDRNWDDVFQTGGYLEHNLSISAGNDRSTYFVSLSRLDQQGIIKESNYDRTNIRFNNEFVATDWLTVTTKSFFTNTNSNRIQQSSNTAGLMLGLLRTPPDFVNSDYIGTYVDEDGARYPLRHRSYRRDLGDRLNPIYNNPNWTVNEQDATTSVNRFTITPQFDIAPTDWLNFILRGNADISTDNRVYFFPIGSGGDRSPGVLAEDGIERSEYNFDAIAKGFFTPTESVILNTTLGFSVNDRNYYRRSGNITGFLVNSRKQTTSLNSANENSIFDDFKTRRRSNRGYGILGVDINDELFLNFSGGLEASSTIEGKFFYPAVDGAWTFTDRYLEDTVLSFGKIRASWGKVGVQPSPHRFTTPAETGFSYTSYSDPLEIGLFGGGFRIDDDLGNADLNPEIKTEWELGTDLRFFDDRLEYSITYYQNEVNDILLFANLTPSTGFDTQYGNFGALENKGLEMDFSWAAIQKRDFSLSIGGNWSTNENEVTRLVGTGSIDLSGGSVSSRAVVGEPLGVLYGTGSLRDDSGDLILDQNGFPQLSEPKVLGDPNPDWRGGFNLNFNYKNFGLNALIEHSQGGEFSPRSLWVLRRFGTTKETANLVTLDQDLVNYDGDVVSSGTTVRGNIKDFGGGQVLLDENWYRTGIGGGFGDNQAYNFSIKDATFTKLREITLSYTFNGNRFRELTKLGSMRVSASGRNLYSWDNIDGIDPETNQTGVGGGLGLEYFTNPQTRSFLFSVSLTY